MFRIISNAVALTLASALQYFLFRKCCTPLVPLCFLSLLRCREIFGAFLKKVVDICCSVWYSK